MRGWSTALVPGMPPDRGGRRSSSQAQGNPLFAVETVRSLIDRDVIVPIEGEYRLVADIGELAVPDSLHALLAARLDALAPRLRVAVADASVLGTTFPADALVAVSEQPPDEVARTSPSWSGATSWTSRPTRCRRSAGRTASRQNMLRQVAYDTLLAPRPARAPPRGRRAPAAGLRRRWRGDHGRRRAALPRRAGALSATRTTRSARKAEASLVRAGERSQRAGAQRRAARSFARAAELQDPDSVQAAALWERAGVAFGAAADFAAAIDMLGRAAARLRRDRRVPRVGSDEGAHGALRASSRSTRRSASAARRSLDVLRTDPDADTVEALQEATSVANFLGEPVGRIAGRRGPGARAVARRLDVADGRAVHRPRHRRQFQRSALRGDRRLQPRGAVGGTMRGSEHGRLRPRQPGLRVLLPRTSPWPPRRWPAPARWPAAPARPTSSSPRPRRSPSPSCCAGTGSRPETALDAVDVEHDWLQAVRAGLLALAGDLAAAETCAALPELRQSDDVQDIAIVAWVDGLAGCRCRPSRRRSGSVRAEVTQDRGGAVGDKSTSSGPGPSRLVSRSRPDGRTSPVSWSGRSRPRRPGTCRRWSRRRCRWRGPSSPSWTACRVMRPTRCSTTGSAQLRAAGSPYHLAHALLDRAEHLAATGRDATALVDEAALIGDGLGAVDIAGRLGDRVLTSPAE